MFWYLNFIQTKSRVHTPKFYFVVKFSRVIMTTHSAAKGKLIAVIGDEVCDKISLLLIPFIINTLLHKFWEKTDVPYI